ncbi:hypothetical protein [Enterobacter roggenkampii]|uniref:hypothetical protein n=1 Tax=Enterobacter roggenkampii TaxID=1812935 RepID=UPI0021C993BD|nr:hypothetical protein [Enterobacter roggenkampii]ELT0931636.1 hypothetical protein [Enterobacter roggenkampii]MCU3128845.1 hypothetical protein [Enterobacter roggenkampii]
MTTKKYATLRGTIARAKRNDCQKVVMRVTLVEELLLQLSSAEKQVAALAAENTGLKAAKEIIRHLNANREEANFCGIDDCYIDDAVAAMITPATDAFLAEMRTNAIKSALNDCSECLDRDCIMDSNGISYEDAALREAGAMALHDALLRQERAV